MSNIDEEMKKVRANFCEGCKSKFTQAEIMNGKKCEGCKKAAEAGRLTAGLQD